MWVRNSLSKKFFALAILSLVLVLPFFAEDERENHFDFSLTTYFAWYLPAELKTGGNHFSAPSGAYDGLGLLETLDVKYVIPFGDEQNVLFADNNFSLGTMLEVTPVTVGAGLNFSLTPIAVLEISGGAFAGTGWEFAGEQGLSYYSPAKDGFKQIDAFKAWFCRFYGAVAFMFDFEALFPGDWHHVVTMASYMLSYNMIAGKPSDCDIYQWQTEFGFTDGLRQYIDFFLGYQMPLKLSMVGANFEFNNYLKNVGIAKEHEGYNGKFKSFSVTPMAQFNLTKKDSLTITINILSRRSFREEHDDIEIEPRLTQCASEWYIEGVGASWVHTF